MSAELKSAFPNTKSVPRPEVEFSEISDPQWLSGFTDGEGCFFVCTRKSRLLKQGMQVNFKFILTQHSRDAKLLKSFTSFLGCGKYYPPVLARVSMSFRLLHGTVLPKISYRSSTNILYKGQNQEIMQILKKLQILWK